MNDAPSPSDEDPQTGPSEDVSFSDQGLNGLADNGSFDDSFGDDRDGPGWPDVYWNLHTLATEWVNEARPTEPQVQELTNALNAPGLVLLGFPQQDISIRTDLLYQIVPHLFDDEGVAICSLYLDEYDSEVVREDALCDHILTLYPNRLPPKAGSPPKERMIALVDCERFEPTPDARTQTNARLDRAGITIVLSVNRSELAQVPATDLTTIDLDTIEFAFRQIVEKLADNDQLDVLNERLSDLHAGLADCRDTLEKIRKTPAQRQQLRDTLDKKLEVATAFGESQPQSGENEQPADPKDRIIKICRDAIIATEENGGKHPAEERLIRETLGLLDPQKTNGPLSLKNLGKNSINEPFATALFLLWAWHKVRPRGVRDNEFKSIFRHQLHEMRAEELNNRARILEHAKAAKIKPKKALKQLRTPASDLLDMGPDAIDRLVAAIGATRNSVDRPRDIGYPREIQILLDREIRRLPSYLADQISRLEHWLHPIFQGDQAITELGRFLFIYRAEENGTIQASECRKAVVERLISWFKILNDPNLNLDLEIQESATQTERYSASLPPEVIEYVRRTKLGERNKRFRRVLGPLISGWHRRSVAENPDKRDEITKHFTSLVTDLLQEMIHLNGFNQALSLFRTFVMHRPELVNVQSILRIAMNSQGMRFVEMFIKILESDSYRFGKIGAQLDAYKFIVRELSDETRLAGRALTEQWAVSSLAWRILPGIVQRLQHLDYEPTEDATFSTDPLLAAILTEPKGIEELVGVLMNDRIAKVAPTILDDVDHLAAEDTKATDAEVRQILQRDFLVVAFHCVRMWIRIAEAQKKGDLKSGAAQKSVTDVTADAPSQTPDIGNNDSALDADEDKVDANVSTFVNQTKADLRKEWWKSIDGTPIEKLVELYQDQTEMFAFSILQELDSMFLASGRTDIADRIVQTMRLKMNPDDGGMPREVVRYKIDVLKEHCRTLVQFRRQYKTTDESFDTVNLWLSFAEARIKLVDKFDRK